MEETAQAKPILFNTDMVCAILDGRKTVTRRVVKPQPNGTFDQHWGGFYEDDEWILLKEPYRPGDVLWVRETWAYGCTFATERKLFYRADGESDDVYRWRPSIHMPREAARIFLRVTGVRVERLQEIDGAGIYAEGTDGKHGFGATRGAFAHLWDSTIKPADREHYGWAANPWVWVIAFERCEKPEEG